MKNDIEKEIDELISTDSDFLNYYPCPNCSCYIPFNIEYCDTCGYEEKIESDNI